MKKRFGDLLNKFIKSEYVIGHQKGLWNKIFYMKYGKGPSDMIGITAKPRSVQIWANCHYKVHKTYKIY